MLITLRLPRTSAMRLGLSVTGVGRREVVVTMTAVELAGRLSLATSRTIGPQAVVDYCVAWQAASETLERLVKEHGKTGLPRIVRKACKDRALWAPRTNVDMLDWLQCLLEAHFLSQAGSPNGVGVPESACLSQLQSEVDLAELCLTNFSLAYSLWAAGEESRAQSGTGRGSRATPR